MKRILILALTAVAALTVSCKGNGEQSIYDFTATSNEGTPVHFSDYKGKVLLIVNTASRCGFTPQYDALETLYRKYQDRGLEVIGFPCDQFGHQEPGSDEEIAEFCRMGYDISFPLMAKSDVNGAQAQPVFKWLYAQKPFAGFGDSETAVFMDRMLKASDPDYAAKPDIKWNFTKFLVDRKGQVAGRYEPTTAPEEMEGDILAALDAAI